MHPAIRRGLPFALATALALFSLSGIGSAERLKTLPTIRELFRDPMYRRAIISPGGEYVAAEFFTDGQLKVVIVEVERNIHKNVMTVDVKDIDAWISQLLWADGDSLLITVDKKKSRLMETRESVTYVVELKPTQDDLQRQFYEVGVSGTVIDPLPALDDEILYSPKSDSTSVYRVKLSELPRYDPDSHDEKAVSLFTKEALVAHLDQHVVWWIPDAKGQVRCAFTVSEDPVEVQIWYRTGQDAPWSLALEQADPERFAELIPLGISEDGSKLLVATDRERDRFGLFEYDPATQELGRLLYEHPTAQLEGVIYDYSGSRLLGVTYQESGEMRWDYFAGGNDEDQAHLRATFPGKSVWTTGISRDRRRVSVLASSPDDPGIFYQVDLDSGRATEIGRVAPWLDDNLLGQMEAFKVRSTDGIEVDAFLTRPARTSEPPPLVVMPHGGPMGFMDVRSFDPLVQYLARSGYAVLQVNYRGSAGYGRAFQESGYRQWGRGIEDDIDAAVEQVMAQGSIDVDRMCVVGASYGGYSALMSVIRHPKRYRCAATLSGVTDIALMFNSSDWAPDAELRKTMTRVTGDPDVDYDELRQNSPVYHASEIQVPIYLAHGIDDRRVDVDHAYRLKALLDLYEVPVRWELMKDTGHGFSTRDDEIHYYVNLRRFLADSFESQGSAEPADDENP